MMAAPCARLLVSSRAGRCWGDGNHTLPGKSRNRAFSPSWRGSGNLMGAISRRVSILRLSTVEHARSLHTKSSLREHFRSDDPVYRGSNYVAGAKAQNPMKKVGIAWAIGFPSGILLFMLAKNRVDKRRLEQMKARKRMRDANKGEYKSERFNTSV